MILVSGDLHRIISDRAKNLCRKIDVGTMNETPASQKEIYSVDFLNVEQYNPEAEDYEP